MVKLHCIIEVDQATTAPQARAVLNAFRESVLPAMNYGLTIYEEPIGQACFRRSTPDGVFRVTIDSPLAPDATVDVASIPLTSPRSILQLVDVLQAILAAILPPNSYWYRHWEEAFFARMEAAVRVHDARAREALKDGHHDA